MRGADRGAKMRLKFKVFNSIVDARDYLKAAYNATIIGVEITNNALSLLSKDFNSNNATAFIIERGTSGFSAGKKENKLGMRASETCEMIFENCRISDTQRMGAVGDGFKQAMKIIDGGRISIAALSIGIAKGAYEAALQYAKERYQFDQPIANFQGISFKLADMATEIMAADLLVWQS